MVRNPAPRIHAGQRRSHRRMRHAHTLVELTITARAAIARDGHRRAAARRNHRTLAAASAAAADVVNALVLTREAALARGTTATFVIDVARGEVRVTCGADTIARRAIAALHGVTLAASGDSVRFGPDGLASGVSNTTMLLVRGARVDSVVVSRLGRIRWTGHNNPLVVGSWWLVVGGWWLVVGGWWLVGGGWWREMDGARLSSYSCGRHCPVAPLPSTAHPMLRRAALLALAASPLLAQQPRIDPLRPKSTGVRRPSPASSPTGGTTFTSIPSCRSRNPHGQAGGRSPQGPRPRGAHRRRRQRRGGRAAWRTAGPGGGAARRHGRATGRRAGGPSVQEHHPHRLQRRRDGRHACLRS